MTREELEDLLKQYKPNFLYMKIEERMPELYRYFGMHSAIEFKRALDRAILVHGQAYFPSPGQINEHLAQVRFSKELEPLESYQWVSKAPKFSGEKFHNIYTGDETKAYREWKMLEKDKRYKSKGTDGYIYLIQNPDVWDWQLINGKITFIRPPEEKTSVKYPHTKSFK